MTQAGAESLALVADDAMTRASKALVVDSSIAHAKVASHALIVRAEADLMALTMDAPMTCAGADSTALEMDAPMKQAGVDAGYGIVCSNGLYLG